MKKLTLLIILGIVLLTGFVFVTDSRFNNILDSSKEPRGMTDQDNRHGGGPTSTIQSHRSYKVEVTTSSLDKISPGKAVDITYKIKNDKGETVKNFDIVHEKVMHFITVRKDLQYFQHLHPVFNQQTGEFTVSMTFPTDGPYRLFPDFTPSDENPQKLPVTTSYDAEIGNINKYRPQKVEVNTENIDIQAEYQIAYTFPVNITTKSESTYKLAISQDGHIVDNLEPYLGALGHSVILKEGTLDFIHTHAQVAAADRKGSQMSFTTSFPEKGNYKTFTQFQRQGRVTTTDYTIEVK